MFFLCSAAIEEQVRKRDAQRLDIEVVGRHYADRALFTGKRSERQAPSAPEDGIDS